MASSEKGNFGNHAGKAVCFASVVKELGRIDKGNPKVILGNLITFLKGNFLS
jgi:hypothetical protein